MENAEVPLGEFHHEDLAAKQHEINREVSHLKTRLDSQGGSGDVSRLLVSILRDALNLESESESLVFQNRDRVLSKERLEAQRKAEDTVTCMILDKADESGQLNFATHEPTLEDRYYSVDIYHPETPEDVRTQLRELEVEDIVVLSIGRDRHEYHFVYDIGG